MCNIWRICSWRGAHCSWNKPGEKPSVHPESLPNPALRPSLRASPYAQVKGQAHEMLSLTLFQHARPIIHMTWEFIIQTLLQESEFVLVKGSL